MLVLNFEQFIGLQERAFNTKITLDYAGMTKAQLELGVINQMLKSQVCVLGLIESGVEQHPGEYEWLEDLEMITADDHHHLTDAGIKLFDLWHFYFHETYKMDPKHLRSHWYAGNTEPFYGSNHSMYKAVTELARNSKSAMDRFASDLRSGLSYYTARKQLQYTSFEYHSSVYVPVANDGNVEFIQEYLPTDLGLRCLKIAAAYHGVPL